MRVATRLEVADVCHVRECGCTRSTDKRREQLPTSRIEYGADIFFTDVHSMTQV